MEENITFISNLKTKDLSVSLYHKFLEDTKNPNDVNLNLLLKIINDNKDTEYGKKYSFGKIKNYDDFKNYVPIINYDDIKEDVERMAQGEKNILTAYPFNHMNQTSGTIGKQKKIPMTLPLMDVFKNYDKFYEDGLLYQLFGDAWAKGKIFCGAQGKATTLESGITVGDASSVMAKSIQGGKEGFNALMNIFYTSPVEASIPEGSTDTRYLHCLFALMEKNITGILFGYFGIVVNYLDYIYANHKSFIKDIKTGKINKNISIDPASRKSLESRMKPNVQRAKELEEIFSHLKDKMFVKKVWPNLLFVRGVGGASFSVYTESLKRNFIGTDVTYLLSGITASEGLYTVIAEPNNEDGILAIGSVFFEFLPVDSNGDYSKIVTVDGLEKDKVYELVITNLSGFYRYRMSDCVKVVGYCNKTPRLRYMYRLTNMINLNAEKTTEDALNAAIKAANEELGGEISDYVACGNTKHVPAHYDIFIQINTKKVFLDYKKVEKVIEKHLCVQNEEYKVSLGEDFDHLRILRIPAYTTDMYREMRIKNGASSMQCKPIHILTTDAQKSYFYSLATDYRKPWRRFLLNHVFRFSNKITNVTKHLFKFVGFIVKLYGKKMYEIMTTDDMFHSDV